jgi:hypothetical protein
LHFNHAVATTAGASNIPFGDLSAIAFATVIRMHFVPEGTPPLIPPGMPLPNRLRRGRVIVRSRFMTGE